MGNSRIGYLVLRVFADVVVVVVAVIEALQRVFVRTRGLDAEFPFLMRRDKLAIYQSFNKPLNPVCRHTKHQSIR